MTSTQEIKTASEAVFNYRPMEQARHIFKRACDPSIHWPEDLAESFGLEVAYGPQPGGRLVDLEVSSPETGRYTKTAVGIDSWSYSADKWIIRKIIQVLCPALVADVHAIKPIRRLVDVIEIVIDKNRARWLEDNQEES